MSASAPRILIGILLVLVAAYILVLALTWRLQERIVWQPPRLAKHPAGAGARRLEYVSEDGQPLFAYLVGDPARAPGTLIAFHGNADLAGWLVPWAAAVERHTGWAVLLPEYRGYGGLSGAPDYVSSQRDARAAYRLARERLGADSARIALFGHSLGSAIAAELAADRQPAVLILVAPFTSARDMARAMLVLPVSSLWSVIGRVRFDTRLRVSHIDAPVWVAHGDRDRIIPVRMGRAVHAAARRQGELLIVRGAGHNDVGEVEDEAYWDWLGRALRGVGRSG
ncbi:MAG: alpha/beta hydrolase [Gemmatimonadaceae bacterium]